MQLSLLQSFLQLNKNTTIEVFGTFSMLDETGHLQKVSSRWQTSIKDFFFRNNLMHFLMMRWILFNQNKHVYNRI